MKRFSSIKTTNSRQTSGSSNRFVYGVGLFFCLSLIFWLWPAGPAWLASQIFVPIFRAETDARAILTLRSKDAATQEETTEAYLKQENEELRTLLNDKTDDDIVASVIGRPNNLPYDVLIIDQGSDDGIKANTPVYIADNTAIGVVARVYSEHSIVALVSTPNFSSTVYIYGPNIYTTITGIGGGVARVHVPQGIDLNVGDVVALPALNSGFYGSVTYVDSVPSRPEQYGYVTINTPLNSLHFVTVGREIISRQDFDAAKEVVDRLRSDLLSVEVPEGVLVDIETASSTMATSSPSSTATSTATSTP